MTYGAGIVAARRFRATPVDPRPHAVGSFADLAAIVHVSKPVIRVRCDLEETDPAAFEAVLGPIRERARSAELVRH